MTDNNNLDSQQEQQINTEDSSEEDPKLPTASTTTKMAEIEQSSANETVESGNKKASPGGLSFSIWPPTQRTRDAVMNRLIETLSSPSVLSKRYGVVPHDEASEAAKRIEEEAFAFAGASATNDEDGIAILQVYSKEISRRMLETVKSRSASAIADAPESKPEVEEAAAAAEVEEASSVTNES